MTFLRKLQTARATRSRKGFSLVVALVMMALMLLVAITLVSFVYVQSKLTEAKLKRAQAQINAISGMRIALGQLQLLTGDDRRITATGDILGGDGNNSLPTGEAANGKRYWTGVWATGGLDKEKLRDWSVYSPDSKPFLGWLVSDYDSSKEVYSPNENPISAETALKKSSTDSVFKVVQDDKFDADDEKIDVITLVGAGTLGSEPDAAGEHPFAERQVKVRRVPLTRWSAATTEALRPTSGAFAYWVGDEGVKARVNIAPATREQFLSSDWQKSLATGTAGSVGVGKLTGLENFESWLKKDLSNATSTQTMRLPLVNIPEALAVYAGSSSDSTITDAAKKLFHDVSFSSNGIFTDVYNGGLKTDLSVAFEMPWFSGGEWKKGFRDIKQFHGSGEFNRLNLLDKYSSSFTVPKDEKWWTSYSNLGGGEGGKLGLGYLYEIKIENPGKRYDIETSQLTYLRGPTWDLVRNYYRLYKRLDEEKGFRGFSPQKKTSWIAVGMRPYSYLSGGKVGTDGGMQTERLPGDGQGQFGPKANYSRLVARHAIDNSGWSDIPLVLTEFSGKQHAFPYGKYTDAPIVPQQMKISPVVRRVYVLFSIIMNQDTAALCFDPVFTIHNPYSVPLEFFGLGATWWKYRPFAFKLKRTDADETTQKTNTWKFTGSAPTLSDNSTAFYQDFKDIMGQGMYGDPIVTFIARVFAGTTSKNSGASGSIRLEPGETKVVYPVDAEPVSTADSSMILKNTGGFLGSTEFAAQKTVAGVLIAQKDGNWKLDPSQMEGLAYELYLIPKRLSESTTDNQYNHDDFDFEAFSFNLFYPEGSGGKSTKGAGKSGLFRTAVSSDNDGASVLDVSDEHLMQVITARRKSYADGDANGIKVDRTLARTGGTGFNLEDKEIFGYVDIKDLGARDDVTGLPSLAGPFTSNARPWVCSPNGWDGNIEKRNAGFGWHYELGRKDDEFQITSEWGDYAGTSQGQNNIVLFEIPQAPLVSTGQLMHVDCSVLDMEPSYVIGNSYAHIGFKDDELNEVLVWPAVGYMTGSQYRWKNQHSPQPRGDTPFAANLNLFDRYFFSGVNFHDDDGATFSGQSKDMKTFVENAFSSDLTKNPFPNKRVSLIRDFGTRKESDVQNDFYDPEKIARNLMFAGTFNVNSTSVEAWKAVLSSLYKSALLVDGKIEELSQIPVVRFAAAVGSKLGGFGGKVSDGGGDEGSGWRWFVKLSDDEIEKLAEAIVDEVRARGPFMSMGDFVNRRLGTGEQAKAGALQTAIDKSKINDSRQSRFSDSGANNPDSARFPNLFPTDFKSKKRGIPGYVSQPDLLYSLAPGLSARSDTFTIRAYGDVSGISGTPEARVWCEAVVQRMPEFFDPQYDEESESEELIDVSKFQENYRNDQNKNTTTGRGKTYVLDKFEVNDKLSAVNKLFGRRYKIISFRWLSPDEI